MKEWTNKYNPFNSNKLMAHIYRWREIKRNNPIPQPVTITVDPVNVCDLKCIWCNSDYILRHNNSKIDSTTLLELPDFLAEWQGNPSFKKGVDTVCIAGGGEPLLHNDIGRFIIKCHDLGIQTGIVTNGTNIHKHLKSLLNCTWVGISIDAGTRDTYKTIKGKDMFDQVIKNLENISELAASNKDTPLGQMGQGPGVSYKFLLHPQNVQEIYETAKNAKTFGCKNLHVRPFSEPWDKIGQLKAGFSHSIVRKFRNQLKKARKLEDDVFKVFGITHKVNHDFRRSNKFNNCYSIFMTGVFMPPKSEGKFDYGLCCDRRGDVNQTLYDLTDFKQVADYWGSEKHWEAFDKINVKKCPRCTYQPHNIIYEEVIEKNNTTYDFI